LVVELAFPAVAGRSYAGDWLTGEEARRLAVSSPERVFAVKDSLPEKRIGQGGTAGAAAGVTPPERVAATKALFDRVGVLAQEALSRPVSRCVIAVPPVFGPAERERIHRAARTARMEVLALIHDSLAVALARGPRRRRPREILVVVSAGAGFTGASLVTRDGHRYREVASAGRPLGGAEVHEGIGAYLLEEFQRQPGWPKDDPAALASVLRAAAQTVTRLARRETVHAVVLHGGRTFTALLSRSQVEAFREPIARYLRETIAQLWADWGDWARAVAPGCRSPVIVSGGGLVGTASIRRALRAALPGARVEPAYPPGFVAQGASLWGRALLTTGPEPGGPQGQAVIAAVAPWSIALGAEGNRLRVLFRAGSTLPRQGKCAGIDLGESETGRSVIKLYASPATMDSAARRDDVSMIGHIRCEDRRVVMAADDSKAQTPDSGERASRRRRDRITLTVDLTRDGLLSVRGQGDDGDPSVTTQLWYPGLEALDKA
jgi:molecular chaperone DnaK (HSP70)